jgi:NAD(P)-dependent dehydrogenase (short-subunit alcohol dehydrogenase family)
MRDQQSNGAKRFTGQVALVVGGAQGIGKAIALRLGQEGAAVVVADIDCSAAEATVQEMRAAGADARSLQSDVRDDDQVKTMVQRVLESYRQIDILMYVAGIAPSVPFLELSSQIWDDTIDTNLRGAFLVAREVTPHMVARRRGKLVFMASTNCFDAEATLAHYNVSKSGVFLLAKTLARELGPYGINSNALGPGFIKTRLTEPVLNNHDFMQKYGPERGLIPLGRLGTPEDVAGPALFLASEDAAYINGVLLFVDGGQLA